MPSGKQWEHFTEADWSAFAARWLVELNDPAAKSDVGGSVVMMNFTATAQQQWAFICAAISMAKFDDDLGHIAAGPLEHLLWQHGEDFIGLLEQQVAADSKFSRAVTSVWRHGMSDDVWARVQALQQANTDPLRSERSS
jgi:hypothetical protein